MTQQNVDLSLEEIFRAICDAAEAPGEKDYRAAATAITHAERNSSGTPAQAKEITRKIFRDHYLHAESERRVADQIRQMAEENLVKSIKTQQIMLTLCSRMHPDLHEELVGGPAGEDPDWRERSTSVLQLHTIHGISMRTANAIYQRFPKLGMFENHRVRFGLRTMQGIGDIMSKRIERRMQETIASLSEKYYFVPFDYRDMAEVLLKTKGCSEIYSRLPEA